MSTELHENQILVNQKVDSLLDALQLVVKEVAGSTVLTAEEFGKLFRIAAVAHERGAGLKNGPYMGRYENWTPQCGIDFIDECVRRVKQMVG